MKCEHGKNVTVIIVPTYEGAWDSGIDDENGKPVYDDRCKLKVVGCAKCQEIDAKISWKENGIVSQ